MFFSFYYQGMDSTNERRIMDLIMDLSGNPDSCQYFLVSPKVGLLMNYELELQLNILNIPFTASGKPEVCQDLQSTLRTAT
jgi:hypothetical protein